MDLIVLGRARMISRIPGTRTQALILAVFKVFATYSIPTLVGLAYVPTTESGRMERLWTSPMPLEGGR